MRNDPDGSALNVACPCCGRRPGKACVSTSNGRPFSGWVHRERLVAAQELPESEVAGHADYDATSRNVVIPFTNGRRREKTKQ